MSSRGAYGKAGNPCSSSKTHAAQAKPMQLRLKPCSGGRAKQDVKRQPRQSPADPPNTVFQANPSVRDFQPGNKNWLPSTHSSSCRTPLAEGAHHAPSQSQSTFLLRTEISHDQLTCFSSSRCMLRRITFAQA
eukprot:scaffold18730_cov29-Tisochrysis_lutea.AAC.2